MKLAHCLTAIAAALISANTATGQQPTLMVDFAGITASFGAPAVTFTGASGALGQWNDINGSAAGGGGMLSTAPLIDAAGNPTGVICHLDANGGVIRTYAEDAPSTTGNDQALLDDCIYFDGTGLIRFDTLPAGTYDIYTYAVAPDAAAFPASRSTEVSVVGSSDGPQIVSGVFGGAYVLGTTHARHQVTVDGSSPVDILISAAAGIESVNGVQIVPVGGNPITLSGFCNGNPNSTGAVGMLAGFGSTSTAANDVTLVASGMPPQQFGIFVVAAEANMSTRVNQGILCLSGQLGRFVGPGQIFQVDGAGDASLVLDLTAIPLGNAAFPVTPGDTLFFQAWHRDLGPQPSSNFTEGFSVTFD